ncbi:MAG: small subunit of phenylpropionate dioxygenase [Chloroflexi bacterium]|nr:small subunit of phenylpropionate dioxygenase [Chloroflexota bacterium]
MVAEQTRTRDAAIERLLLVCEIEEFLFAEAELLDQHHYSEWLDLFTEDAHYFMPIRRNVKYGEQDRESTSDETDVSWFDEGKGTLAGRVRQLATGYHWAEEPQSRTTHMVTNVQIVDAGPQEVSVRSRFLVYRNRLMDETDFFVGKREDVLRRDGDSWKIARRKILLDQKVLLAKNVTVFF